MSNSHLPSISVIMTVYNAELFIDKAIQSILNQTFIDFEFIIIDDGSEDKSAFHIRQYADSRIVFIPRIHCGRAKTLNFAVTQARSSLIAFMDADDISKKERLEFQYAVFKKYPEIGVLSSWFYRVTATGQIKRLVRLPEKHDAIESMMTRSCSILFGASMMRKSLIEQVQGFNFEHNAEDWDLFLRLLPLTLFYNVQKPLLYYRQHGNSITGKYQKLQQRDSYLISRDYLLRKLELSNSLVERRQILFRLSLCEFSLGTITSARIYLSEAAKMGEHSIHWAAYFFLFLLGDRTISLVRNIRDIAKRVVLNVVWKVKP
jgi:glycosyltransferase involved in cell wall biosynthesis